MKLLLLFSTILLALTLNNFSANACLPYLELVASLNVNSSTFLDSRLDIYEADDTTKEGFHKVNGCLLDLTQKEKGKLLYLQAKIMMSPICQIKGP
ncbi:uteroglobin-like [Monodelphis domestica]|uniref:uteroglobin-like n=1 Tax=Monodelphis domestica TaxID=13616 RepID=UPI0024E1C35A|nr:uteroglobin-like [Monodelphis domestica]